MGNIVKKSMDKVLKPEVLSKFTGKATSAAVNDSLSKLNPIEVINSLVNTYSDYKKIAAQAKKDQERIKAWKKVELKRIQTQRDILMTYLEKSFDERRNNFEELFKRLDLALEKRQIDIVAKAIESITVLAKSSPFKEIASISQVHNMIVNNDEPIDL